MNRVGLGTLDRQKGECSRRPNTKEEHAVFKKMKEARTLAEGLCSSNTTEQQMQTWWPFIVFTPAVPLVMNAIPFSV